MLFSETNSQADASMTAIIVVTSSPTSTNIYLTRFHTVNFLITPSTHLQRSSLVMLYREWLLGLLLCELTVYIKKKNDILFSLLSELNRSAVR